ICFIFFFSSRRRHTRWPRDWSSDVCSSDLASSLDQGGPLAKSAADLAAMMNVMAGFDARDSTSLERPKEDYGRSLNRDLRGLRIGLPREYFGDGIDPGVRNAVEEATRWFESQGARGVQIELPHTKLAVPV